MVAKAHASMSRDGRRALLYRDVGERRPPTIVMGMEGGGDDGGGGGDADEARGERSRRQ